MTNMKNSEQELLKSAGYSPCPFCACENLDIDNDILEITCIFCGANAPRNMWEHRWLSERTEAKLEKCMAFIVDVSESMVCMDEEARELLKELEGE